MNTVPATPAQRVAALREAMRREKIDAWIIPSGDPHLSEDSPAHWEARHWVSGFCGSAGTLVLTADTAEMWTDSRYWVQAERDLAGSGIEMKKLEPGQTHIAPLVGRLPEKAVVGMAAESLPLAEKRRLEQAFAAKGIVLRLDTDLLDGIWLDRPGLPAEPVYPQKPEFVPEQAAAKLAKVRAEMQRANADYFLLSTLDDIAWLTNLRGSDVPYNPVFLAYMLIGAESATLFADPCKFGAESLRVLAEAGIATAAYGSIGQALAGIRGRLLVCPGQTAVGTLAGLPGSVGLVEGDNPVSLLKAQKSDAEIAHTREAMIQDGAALCGFFAELEQKLGGGEAVTELGIDTMLAAHRSRRPHYISDSFATIAGFKENGALPHYCATPEHHSTIAGKGLLLIDSGAHYHNGTTDITRVIPVGGEPSEAQKRDYTLVLKAHIALAEAVFPEGLAAPLLDSVCRVMLWREQRDYGHGTGHGVGYCLNVHQGPQVLSYRAPVTRQGGMLEGMLTSDEPGLYRPGRWGIRIENVLANRRVENPAETEFGRYLCFEVLTLCPIDTRLIERGLMSEGEIRWLNGYHALVREKLAPHVEGAAKAWLEKHTRPV